MKLTTLALVTLELNVHPPAGRAFDASKAVPLKTDLPRLKRELGGFLRTIAELPPDPQAE